jgi:AraC family transcriptional regulator, transcriptional activator of pobA
MTPRQVINRRLLFEARRLLRFTNASCSDVAAELGFEDPSYFSRFHRRMTGRSPSAERRREPQAG